MKEKNFKRLFFISFSSLIAGTSCGSGAWAASDSHEAPAPSLAAARAVSGERQKILSELWQRRIISTEAADWTAADMSLLLRLRSAEEAGAFDFLRKRHKTLKRFAVEYRPAGASLTRVRLTKDGYDRYIFLRTQDAIKYFEGRGVEAKWAFSLRDLDDRPLFNDAGLLTTEGDSLFTRASAGKPAFWRTASGEVMGNRPPQSRPVSR